VTNSISFFESMDFYQWSINENHEGHEEHEGLLIYKTTFYLALPSRPLRFNINYLTNNIFLVITNCPASILYR
jgi:hypothetical protein